MSSSKLAKEVDRIVVENGDLREELAINKNIISNLRSQIRTYRNFINKLKEKS